MKKNSILISIIIPAYNIEKYLGDCLDSIMPQLDNDVEAILVDDGSSDETGMLCDQYAKSRLNIIAIHQKNQGVSAARNKGFEKSKGEYVFFVDGDDLLAGDAIKQLKLKINDLHPDIITGGLVKFSDNSAIKPHVIEDKLVKQIEKSADAFTLLLESSLFMPSMSTTIFARKLVKKDDRLFDTKLAHNEDIDCALGLYLNAKNIAILQRSHYFYRQAREGSATANYHFDRVKNSLSFIKIWVKRIGEMPKDAQKLWLMDYMLYQYLIVLGTVSFYPKMNKQELLEKVSDYVNLFDYAIGKKTKLVATIYKLFGLKTTITFLGIFMRLK